MKNHFLIKRWYAVVIAGGLMASGWMGCSRSLPTRWQGYLEGEFIYVGAPLAGQLESLAVQKGSRVEAGAVLFTLERSAELAQQQQTARQLEAAQARVADLKKGSRPSEIAALQAQLDQARTAAELAGIEFKRIETLHQTQVVSDNDFDRALLTFEQAGRFRDQLEAQLATARLGARPDVVAAAEAEAESAAANHVKATWSVEQITQAAPRAGLVYDTLYRAGEFVPAGSPVVSLLAPELLKVRFFLPAADFATLKAGDAVKVTLGNRNAPLEAHVSYLSPQPEYTPPVLYNRENRSKLVFMVEATFSTVDARDLHPGQPVDVSR
jgi:HlyD family secretion protein